MTSPLDSLLVAIVLWVIVYLADYSLTLYGRQLWLKNAKDFLRFQGSYELNPYYERDVEANKWVSRRFIFMLAFGILWMLFMYGATHYLNITQIFPAAVGFLILLEVVVLSTHVQNVRSFTVAAIAGAIEGQISYARWVSIDGSAWKFAYWGIIYLIFALLTSNWFFAGGALACLYEFLVLRQRGFRMRTQTPPAKSSTT